MSAGLLCKWTQNSIVLSRLFLIDFYHFVVVNTIERKNLGYMITSVALLDVASSLGAITIWWSTVCTGTKFRDALEICVTNTTDVALVTCVIVTINNGGRILRNCRVSLFCTPCVFRSVVFT